MQRKNFPSERDPYFLEHPTKGWTESEDDPHPISLEHLYAMVELSQVGLNNRTWLHSDVISARKPAVKAVVSSSHLSLLPPAGCPVEVSVYLICIFYFTYLLSCFHTNLTRCLHSFMISMPFLITIFR